MVTWVKESTSQSSAGGGEGRGEELDGFSIDGGTEDLDDTNGDGGSREVDKSRGRTPQDGII